MAPVIGLSMLAVAVMLAPATPLPQCLTVVCDGVRFALCTQGRRQEMAGHMLSISLFSQICYSNTRPAGRRDNLVCAAVCAYHVFTPYPKMDHALSGVEFSRLVFRFFSCLHLREWYNKW